MNFEKSSSAFEEAQKLFPGGVNSPVRAFRAVGGEPVFFLKGKGARTVDADGNEYVDFCQSWGAHILGHAPKTVIKAVKKRLTLGTSFGAPTLEETRLARTIREALPSMQRLRFVNSGTEAVMSALRLARAFTGRKYILKFDGCYHGHADPLLVKAGSGLATLNQPASAGIPDDFTAFTISVPYNDTQALKNAFAAHRDQIACVIVEPVAANMGLILPQPGFLNALRETTRAHGALLIFDEVITGFRVGWGGAQGLFTIEPDLTTLGKIMGGGFPAAAYGGRQDIMDLLSPLGPVYQAGTLSGNPAAMAAGSAVLEALRKPGFYDAIHEKAQDFFDTIKRCLDSERQTLSHFAGLFTLFFARGPLNNFSDAQKSDTEAYARFFRALLKRGIYTAPSQFEANFIGSAHGRKALTLTARAIGEALSEMK